MFFIHVTCANEAIDLYLFSFLFHFHRMQLMLFFLLLNSQKRCANLNEKNEWQSNTGTGTVTLLFILLNSIHLKYTYSYHCLPKLKSIHLIHSQWHLDIFESRARARTHTIFRFLVLQIPNSLRHVDDDKVNTELIRILIKVCLLHPQFQCYFVRMRENTITNLHVQCINLI